MARDVKLLFDSDLLDGDVILKEGDLDRDEGIGTAVMISLYTDRLAEETDNYDNNDRKGWWGDNLPQIEGDQIGSRLWLLLRSKDDQYTQINAKKYIFEALEWLVEDGVAAKIEIDTWVFGDTQNKRLGALIQIYRKDGNVVSIKFDDLWKNTSTIGVYNAVQ